MGIGIGQDWRFSLFVALGGQNPYHRVRLRKFEQQKLLEVARTPILKNDSNDFSQLAERSPEQCTRDYAIVAVMLYGGLFPEEVVGLETDAITADECNYWISFTGYDGENNHHVILSEVAAEAIADYLSITGRKPDNRGSLFLSTVSESNERKPLTVEFIASLLESLMQEAWVEPCRITPYSLRNSFSKEWLDSGRDIDELQRVLGIKSPEAMRSYVSDLNSGLINEEEEQ